MSGVGYQLEIRLPEGVTFWVPLSGPISRCLAFLIDLCTVSALSTALERILAPIRVFQEDLGTGLIILLYLAVWLLYGTLCEYYWQGQTLGKWLLKLRVMDSTGLELRFSQIAIRNLIRSVDLFPVLGLIGGIAMLSNRRLQRLGDLAAGTVVVRNRQPRTPNLDAIKKGRYNSLLEHQVLCGRLRQRVPAQAAAVALEAVMRRDRLEDRARVLLFNELAAYFRSLVEFPAEDLEQLSSEQFVRDVIEILYSTAKRQPLAASVPVTR